MNYTSNPADVCAVCAKPASPFEPLVDSDRGYVCEAESCRVGTDVAYDFDYDVVLDARREASYA